MFTPILTALFPTRATFYLIILAFISGGVTVAWFDHELKMATVAMRLAETLAVERGNIKLVNVAATARYKLLVSDFEKSKRTRDDLQAELKNMGKCSIPGGVVGVFNNAVNTNPGPTAGTKPPVAPATPDPVEFSVFAENTRSNYQDVCIPNARDFDSLRNLYLELQRKINGTGHR